MKRLETLRRIWSPNREIEELTANLDPRSELDSIIRDYFSRIIQREGNVTLNLDAPVHGTINWEVVGVEIGPGRYQRQATIWWEPDERTLLFEKLTK